VITAVMFDFSQTLFRSEATDAWLDAGLARVGLELPAAERTALAQRLVESGGMPGGPEPRRLPEELRGLWGRRDLDAASHRGAYESLTLAAGLPEPAAELATVLYDRHMEPEAWRPFPDAEATLKELRRRGIPVAVVSNIGWDPRPLFVHFGLDELIGMYVLSYEHGAQKPDGRGQSARRRRRGGARLRLPPGRSRAGRSAAGCARRGARHARLIGPADGSAAGRQAARRAARCAGSGLELGAPVRTVSLCIAPVRIVLGRAVPVGRVSPPRRPTEWCPRRNRAVPPAPGAGRWL
jgi:putative hydrolase of the HAD superfamily